MKKYAWIFLLPVLILGFWLRTINFSQITFTYDQARDAFEALDIWRGDHFRLLGPATDLGGLFHGPFYWYMLSPLYHFSNGNIAVVKVFLILFNLVNAAFIYFFSKKLFKNRFVGVLSALLFALSFEAVQYGRWISNPAPAVLTNAIFFYGLWLFVNNRKRALPLMVLGLGLSIQFQFFMTYLFFLILPIFIYKLAKKTFTVSRSDILLTFISLLVFSTFILAEFKFGFQGFKALLKFLSEEKPLFNNGFIAAFNVFMDRIFNTFSLNVFGKNALISGLCTLSVLIYSLFFAPGRYKRQVFFLIVWLFSPILLFSFEKNSAQFATIGILYPAIILTSFTIHQLFVCKKELRVFAVLFVLFVSITQIGMVYRYTKNGEVIFAVQDKMLLSDQKKVIDWIYKESRGKPFSLNTVTNPLFINTTWSYLFDWYGKNRYGYMPSWVGYPQDGVYGSQVRYTPKNIMDGTRYFLIIEPTPGIPDMYIFVYVRYENSRSTLIKKQQIGGFTVEERIFGKYKDFSREDLFKKEVKTATETSP